MYTLGQFLGTDLLSWYKVFSCEGTLEERPIEYVSVAELPVENFIRKNELILSTAIGCDKDEPMFQLISGVHKSQACALILTQQSNQLLLPQICLDYIKETDFPVILVPWECRFADLLEQALGGIRNWNYTEERFFEKIQQQMLTAYLGNQTFDSAAQIIAGQFHSACAIYNASGQCVGMSSRKFKGGQPDPTDKELQAIPIQTGNQLYGHLYMEQEHPINLMMFDRYLLSPILLWFDKEQVINATRQIEKDNFVWALAKNISDNQQELLQTGRLLGFNLSLPYACVVGSIHTDLQNTSDFLDGWIASNIFLMKEHILNLAGTLRRRVMLTYQQDLLILFVESRSEGDETYANQFLDRLETLFSEVYPHLFFSWGISEARLGPESFHENFLCAKLAQEFCTSESNKNMRYSYKSTTIFSVLTLISDTPKLCKEILSTVEPIKEYDEKNKTDLLHTLQMYLQLRNVSATSRALHLHRQSLIYRLNKIESLTGMALKDANNCFLFEVAVRLIGQ